MPTAFTMTSSTSCAHYKRITEKNLLYGSMPEVQSYPGPYKPSRIT